MKKNYSLVLLGLLATTTISLALDAADLDPEEKKRNRSLLGNPSSVTEAVIPEDEPTKGNKRSKPSSDAASVLDGAIAGTDDGSNSLSVLPTVLKKVEITKFDDQIMKEARDVLTVMLGAVSTDTLTDIYEILSFSRRKEISYDDEKPSVEGLKISLSALSTYDEQITHIETVFGSLLAQNRHLLGLTHSPKDDVAESSGYSSPADAADEGRPEYGYGEDPGATGYGFRADDGEESQDDEEGSEDADESNSRSSSGVSTTNVDTNECNSEKED